jgi:hypothetical protein
MSINACNGIRHHLSAVTAIANTHHFGGLTSQRRLTLRADSHLQEGPPSQLQPRKRANAEGPSRKLNLVARTVHLCGTSSARPQQFRQRCLVNAVRIGAGARRQIARCTQNPDARYECITRRPDRVRRNVGQVIVPPPIR